MKQIISEFCPLAISQISNLHSSSVCFEFSGTTGSNLCALYLDFCVWQLVSQNAVIVDSNDEDLEAALAFMKGSSIRDIRQIFTFSEESLKCSNDIFSFNTVVVNFTNGTKLRIYPHCWSEIQEPEILDSPMVTLRSKSGIIRYLLGGGASFSSEIN